MSTTEQEQALLQLVEEYRTQECQRLRDRAKEEAARLVRQAHTEARRRVHRAVLAERERAGRLVRAARAELQTRERHHAQEASFKVLEIAWDLLEQEFARRWAEPVSRRAWVKAIISDAQTRLPSGEWELVHAPSWPAAEREAVVADLSGRLAVTVVAVADHNIAAGLVVKSSGSAVDGTVAGLLADRRAVQARLLALVGAGR